MLRAVPNARQHRRRRNGRHGSARQTSCIWHTTKSQRRISCGGRSKTSWRQLHVLMIRRSMLSRSASSIIYETCLKPATCCRLSWSRKEPEPTSSKMIMIAAVLVRYDHDCCSSSFDDHDCCSSSFAAPVFTQATWHGVLAVRRNKHTRLKHKDHNDVYKPLERLWQRSRMCVMA